MIESFEALNTYLLDKCRKRLADRLRGHDGTIGERLERDLAAFQKPLPAPYDACEKRPGSVNSLSLVRYRSNDYSVPTAFAHHEVTAIGGIEQVRIACGDQLVATHPRCWEKERITFDPHHYLALLERKPGAFDFARPLEDWDLPDCFALLRRRLEASLGDSGTREYIKVLRLLERSSLRQLAEAVRVALSIGATSSDAISCILVHRTEQPVSMFSLDGHPHLKPYAIEPPDLSAYAAL